MYSRAILRTNLTAPEAERLLASLVTSPLSLGERMNRPARSDRPIPFVGRVQDSRFTFYRVIQGTRGFRLIVTGRIVNGSGGAELHMVLRIGVGIAIFQIAALSAIIATMRISAIDALLPALIGGAVIAMTIRFFVQERRMALLILQGTLPGAIL